MHILIEIISIIIKSYLLCASCIFTINNILVNPIISINVNITLKSFVKLTLFILSARLYIITPSDISKSPLQKLLYTIPSHTSGEAMFPYLCAIYPPPKITINGAII